MSSFRRHLFGKEHNETEKITVDNTMRRNVDNDSLL